MSSPNSNATERLLLLLLHQHFLAMSASAFELNFQISKLILGCVSNYVFKASTLSRFVFLLNCDAAFGYDLFIDWTLHFCNVNLNSLRTTYSDASRSKNYNYCQFRTSCGYNADKQSCQLVEHM